MRDDEQILESEFAAVSIRVDDDGNGPRLRITDLRTGQVGYLDPLELETLSWLPEGAMQKMLDPSAFRWRDRPVNESGAKPSTSS